MRTSLAAYKHRPATCRSRIIAVFVAITALWPHTPATAGIFDHDPLAKYAVEYSLALWHGQHSLAPIEGVWRTSADAYIAIHATGINTYEMVVVHTPDLGIAPGTVMGTARTSGKVGMYDATIFRNFTSDGKGHHPQRLAITVDIATGMLRFDPYKQGWKVNLRRLIPYLFRVTVQREDTRPDGLDGAMRVYPAPPTSIQNPVVL